MNQFLGFITAFFVIGWAVRWYLRQGTMPPAIEWKPPEDDSVLPAATRWESLAEVVVERSLSAPKTVDGSAARVFEYEPADEVERRLEALVQESDEPMPVHVPLLERSEEAEPDQEAFEPATSTNAVDDAEPEGHPAPSVALPEVIVGFCARCRDKRLVMNPMRTQTKKGKAAIRGSCEVCGAGMFVFISEER